MVSVKYPTENKRLTLKVQTISVIKGTEVLTGKSIRRLRPTSSLSTLWLEYVQVVLNIRLFKLSVGTIYQLRFLEEQNE